MKFNILTLFPEFFESPLSSGLLGKAVEKGIISVRLVNIRDYADDGYHRCDDSPYGGGSGMVLLPEPLIRALGDVNVSGSRVLFPTPGGKPFSQSMVGELGKYDELTLVCGHYEGVDQRFIDRYVDCEISIGDYVLSGGEFAALVIIDAIARHIPGFMSNRESLRDESFENDLLEYPHYTRPGEIDGIPVPGILMSGNHKEIGSWRLQKSIEKTMKIRPDLYKKYLVKKIKGEC